MSGNLFQSYLMGGFECSTHRNGKGRRLDVIKAARHDEFALEDYQRLVDFGFLTARDGARWHLIEKTPYKYDFSSVTGQIRAARESGIQIIWDLFHYGYPDDLDIFGTEFINRFVAFSEGFTKLLINEGIEKPFLCPVNEISFFSWIAGDIGVFYPYRKNRGDELKRQLVKAAIRAAKAIRKIAPEAVLIKTEPLINVVPETDSPEDRTEAANYNFAQHDALDMLIGRREPELGGSRECLNVIGINYYPHNQWLFPSRQTVWRGDALYKPLNELLREFAARFQDFPMFISETGIEDEQRPDWFRYVCEEVRAALRHGVPVKGICLYPVVNHPGWDDDRHCHNGLWCYANDKGERPIYKPLAEEVLRQLSAFEPARFRIRAERKDRIITDRKIKMPKNFYLKKRNRKIKAENYV